MVKMSDNIMLIEASETVNVNIIDKSPGFNLLNQLKQQKKYIHTLRQYSNHIQQPRALLEIIDVRRLSEYMTDNDVHNIRTYPNCIYSVKMSPAYWRMTNPAFQNQYLNFRQYVCNTIDRIETSEGLWKSYRFHEFSSSYSEYSLYIWNLYLNNTGKNVIAALFDFNVIDMLSVYPSHKMHPADITSYCSFLKDNIQKQIDSIIHKNVKANVTIHFVNAENCFHFFKNKDNKSIKKYAYRFFKDIKTLKLDGAKIRYNELDIEPRMWLTYVSLSFERDRKMHPMKLNFCWCDDPYLCLI